MSVRAVDNWWARWQTGGRDALLFRPRGRRRGEHQLLSDDEEWALRHVDLQGLQRRPVTAASLAGVIEIRDRGDLAAMSSYERQYGVLAEGTLHGWREADSVVEIARQEFEST